MHESVISETDGSFYNKTRRACYYSYLSMASVFCIPAMLLATFHDTYHVSYTLLGSLVLINFATQFCIDLIFTFFSKHFNVKKAVVTMPILTTLGLFLYALIPMLCPEKTFVGLVVGTVLFSVSAGLSEVLLSPIISAIPNHTERDLSMLHSLYGWGLVLMITVTWVFFRLFGEANWTYLVFFLAALPLGASVLFLLAPIPPMSGNNAGSEKELPTASSNQNHHGSWKMAIGILICALSIFFGSAAENTMTNWISGYMENGLGVPKDYCDIVGILVFAVLLGFTRIWYAKWGKNIMNVLFIGMIGATICYLVAGLTENTGVATVACILTGMFTSMLWPGSLMMMEDHMPGLGVAVYALMAAAGDFGAALVPQLMGIIADAKGLNVGMLVTAIFPTLGILVQIIARFYFKKTNLLKNT